MSNERRDGVSKLYDVLALSANESILPACQGAASLLYASANELDVFSAYIYEFDAAIVEFLGGLRGEGHKKGE